MRTSLLLVVLALTVVVGGIAVASAGSGSPHGDIDCDGDVDSVDALRILRDVAGLQPVPAGCDGGPTQAPGVGLSRDNPVPMGQSYLVPEGWRVTIVDFTANATQIVLDENQFNDPPAPGKRFSMVRIRVENVSAGNPGDPDVTFAMRMVGSENIGYSTFENSCGVIPDSYVFMPNDVFVGGVQEGNVCYETSNNESDFTIFTNYFLADDEDVRWFEVE